MLKLRLSRDSGSSSGPAAGRMVLMNIVRSMPPCGFMVYNALAPGTLRICCMFRLNSCTLVTLPSPIASIFSASYPCASQVDGNTK